MMMIPEKESIKIITEGQIEDSAKLIPIEKNEVIKTIFTKKSPVYISTKEIPAGLLAVFYGKNDYVKENDPGKPYFVWYFLFSKNERENIQRNILDDGYNNWFDLFCDLTKHQYLKADVEWFFSMEKARRYAGEIYQRD